MAEPTIQLGGGNWAGKSGNLLGYYKEGERFYKQDFTFSRASTGTYTDKDGYIQEMPYNLLQQSNQFDTTWSTQDANVTSNEAGYDGSKDAWLFSWTSSTAFLYQSISLKASKNTISIYAKQGTSSNLRLDFVTAGFSKGASCTFDLSNGTAGSVVQYGSSTDFTSAIDSVGSGWYRISLSGTTTATTWYHELALTSGSVYIQNAQLVKGTSAKTYFPTTTRLNMPRVDYLNNSNGSLILEPQRTNLVPYSNDFSNAAWAKEDLSVSANATTSPDGTTNADLLLPNTNNIDHSIYDTTSASTEAFSVFLKAGGYNYAFLGKNNNVAADGAFFDLANGVVSQNTSTLAASIEDYGDGWYRCSLVGSFSTIYRIICTSENGTSFIHAGDGIKGVYAWGAQVEQGSHATTLINTQGSSVTRNADACNITNVADRIGQTEGTIYAEIDFKSKPELGSPIVAIISLNNNVGNLQNTIILGIERQSGGINRFYPFVQVSNSTVANIIGTTLTDGNYKAAFAYKQNDFVLYVNGIQIGTDNSGTVPTTSQILVGQRYNNDAFKFGDGIKETKIYNTRLSNSELATLTTL